MVSRCELLFRCTFPIHGLEVPAADEQVVYLVYARLERCRNTMDCCSRPAWAGSDLPGPVDELPSGWSCGETLIARFKGSLQW